ncbi:ArsR family transcriptional regulator [Defluviimonas sp. 20V17]|uniref:Helix-turn-helix domain-containing protein n=1 Tax=Allgaiera indica TaxID=765699 RepID=A0AAN4ZXK9_9RHOB|nr:ArsR family transcriptional regulator [Defluviimonas sp. 20V17]GHD98639.1 hypothetical protein GCM10008024_02960 [Allgaiera indica]SDW09416.1 Helix-turn-helix domain-containing protein [Allgaiera indica]
MTELAAPHDMALPSLMKHLRKLEAAGLITSVKEGRIRSCALAPEPFVPVQDWLSAQRKMWEDRLDRLDDYVRDITRRRDDGPGSED